MLRLFGEGFEVASRLVPLVFVASAGVAQAQLPRAVPVAVSAQTGVHAAVRGVPAVIEPLPGFAPLTLAANRVEIHVGRERAEVRTRLTYRNDGTTPIEAHYAVPLPATLLQQTAEEAAAGNGEGDGCGSESGAVATDGAAPDDALAAEFAEAGEQDPRTMEAGTLWIAPGDTVTVEMRRPADLIRRAGRMRLVLPLIHDRQATFAPEFSADVLIDAGAPVVELSSATHGGQVSGLGDRIAVLSVPNGRVYEGQFLAVEFALGATAATVDAQAGAPIAVTQTVAHNLDWHGEGRALRRPAQ